MVIGRERLVQLPTILLFLMGWPMVSQARSWEWLFTDLRFILTLGEEQTLLPKPAGFGYVGNILFLQGRGKIPTAKDDQGKLFVQQRRFTDLLQQGGDWGWGMLVNWEVSLDKKEPGGSF